ncbi:hypothetical protein ABZ330_00355 [Streptomyces sp. NPDC006172]|uniref:hypothetical protein n=1 Tax=Streptomyces sp. NPDC006172 TaxID=3154470 RepID=UPI0033DC80A2
MTRLARTAARLADGSSRAARRLGARATTWVARGRRHDLTGWRALLGCGLRLGVLLLGVYLLWRLVRAVPNLMWLVSAAWTAAAWRAGKPPADVSEEALAEASSAPTGEAIRGLLLTLMGEGSGVHLRTVLDYLQEHGQWEGRTVTDLRAHLTRLQIPVDRGVKVAGVPTWGVRRRDLQAPSPVAAREASTAPSTAA